MDKLNKMEGAIVEKINPFNSIIDSPSPSVNFTFSKTWGLPLGYTAVIYGPPKCGKTVLTNLMIGKMMQDDPEALAVKFDTEFRSEGQLTEESENIFGIDSDRLTVVMNNKPDGIFDAIEKTVVSLCQEGAPIKLVVIDSLYGIQGRRSLAAESVSKQIIGDHAATIQDGLKRILEHQRKYRFALILIDQVRSEMDQTEQMRGNKFKMRSSFAVQHHAEYFIAVDQNKNKDGRSDLLGNDLINEELKDLSGKGEQTGIKIKVKMKDSSMGPKGRVGEFTFDFKKGIVNVHEEVFKLGAGRGVIERPNNQTYTYNGTNFRGISAMLEALKNDNDLQKSIIKDLKEKDLAGHFAAHDAAIAKETDDISDFEE